MKSSHRSNLMLRLFILVAIFAMLAVAISAAQPSTSVNIVNNSSGSIRHVYLSHVNADDWGSDQLSAAIQSGQSATLSNLACDSQQIKVIGENQDGCFVTAVIDCGTNGTWTITNATAADCGQ